MLKVPSAEIPALQVNGLSHAYGGPRVLEDLSFHLPRGTFTVLLGLNGAGKTTLFSLITRLFNVQQGAITIQGHDLSRNPGAALRNLGIVFQARTLDLDLTVAQNLGYHAALHGIAKREATERSVALLASMELSDKLHEKARSLSGGQMRRVEIARALLHQPSLLLLDEATVGLDVRSRTAIVQEIRRLVAEQGITVLWATHLIDEVEEGDSVVVLNRGRLAASGSVKEILAATRAADMKAAFTSLAGFKPVEIVP